MAYTNEARKVLGQIDLVDSIVCTAYKVPAATEAIVSSIVFCNRGAAAVLSAQVVPASAGGGTELLSARQFIYWDLSLPANDTFIATIGLTLSAGDQLRIAASTAASSVAVNVFGVELT